MANLNYKQIIEKNIEKLKKDGNSLVEIELMKRKKGYGFRNNRHKK